MSFVWFDPRQNAEIIDLMNCLPEGGENWNSIFTKLFKEHYGMNVCILYPVVLF